jgi:hypothetical protein
MAGISFRSREKYSNHHGPCSSSLSISAALLSGWAQKSRDAIRLLASREEAGPGYGGELHLRPAVSLQETLKRGDLGFDDLPFPKQARTLPTVLSQDEVARLLEATPS